MLQLNIKKSFHLIIVIVLLLGTSQSFAQQENQNASSLKHSDNSNEISIYFLEPAILFNPASLFFGIYETGISMMAGKKTSSYLSICSYTSAKTQFFKKDGMRTNLSNDYHINLSQLLGVQFHFGKNKRNSVGILAGIGFMRYKESIINPDVGLNHTYTSPWILSPNYGIFHQSFFSLKNNASLFLRYYLPLTHCFTLMENVFNSSLEFGLHLRLHNNK